jgi:hypothetical protein
VIGNEGSGIGDQVLAGNTLPLQALINVVENRHPDRFVHRSGCISFRR